MSDTAKQFFIVLAVTIFAAVFRYCINKIEKRYNKYD